MKTLLYNLDLYPDGLMHYPNAALLINECKVEEIIVDYKDAISKYPSYDMGGLVCLPGFIDQHCHGGYGQDFLKDGYQTVANFSTQCVKEGCTAYLASFVSEDRDILSKAMNEYRHIDSNGYARCLGIHMEGPFLNEKRLSVMREGTLRNPDMEEFKEMISASFSNLKYMTIAPELPGALEMIEYGSHHGVSMIMGHSEANTDEALQAISKGALGLTHMYNAMSPHAHRNPGLVTAGLLYESLLCELICDGFHIHPDVIKATYNAIGSDRIVLVTDATLMRGMKDGVYYFSGNQVKKEGIHAVSQDNGRLAGSVVGMIDCAKNIKAYTNCSYNDIVKMASINPSVVCQVSDHKGKLLPTYDCDLVLIGEDMQVMKTYVEGKLVYEA